MIATRPVIAIIGAGFCGTMLAVRLLRSTAERSFDVLLINRPSVARVGEAAPGPLAGSHSSLARGLAYGTNSVDHLLNVPAGRMSAFDESPNDFERYLQRQGMPASGSAFVARKWYGSYLQSTLQAAVESAASHAAGPRMTTLNANVTGLVALADGRHQLTVEAQGTQSIINVDRVVLALGNFLPTNPKIDDERFYDSGAYLRDPWREGALADVNLDLPLLLIGTGLTMYDVAMSLKRRADQHGKRLRMVAISRRGQLPQPHRISVESTVFCDAPPHIAGATSVRRALGIVRHHISQVEEAGGDWRDVLASLRPLTPALWHQLDGNERRRFLRHLRPYWESHRHRAAPAAAATVANLLDSGELVVQAAQLLSIETTPAGVQVAIRGRAAAEKNKLLVANVINCTGPASALQAEPLLAGLAQAGVISADPLGLGLEVTDDYRVLDRAGNAANGIYYVGPLLKAKYWEATAVPELRSHVAAAANTVIASLAK
jgi:uncharacterized NAD(P)/FAD-binding protein YdhS